MEEQEKEYLVRKRRKKTRWHFEWRSTTSSLERSYASKESVILEIEMRHVGTFLSFSSICLVKGSDGNINETRGKNWREDLFVLIIYIARSV